MLNQSSSNVDINKKIQTHLKYDFNNFENTINNLNELSKIDSNTLEWIQFKLLTSTPIIQSFGLYSLLIASVTLLLNSMDFSSLIKRIVSVTYVYIIMIFIFFAQKLIRKVRNDSKFNELIDKALLIKINTKTKRKYPPRRK